MTTTLAPGGGQEGQEGGREDETVEVPGRKGLASHPAALGPDPSRLPPRRRQEGDQPTAAGVKGP